MATSNVMVIGDKTGGSGLPFSRTSKWMVRPFFRFTCSAEKEHIEFGVEPDIYVDMMSDKEKNKDTIIERARSILTNR